MRQMKKRSLKVALIFGTRPEIIKLSPLMRLFELEKTSYFMIHSGQHYSPLLDKIFFDELSLPLPKYNLSIRSKAAHRQGYHTGKMLIEIEKILLRERPTHILVQGDTNTVLAGALISAKISTTSKISGFDFRLGHVEAGLRSYDRQMPEEINRFISDHLSDLLFSPTQNAKNILVNEGISTEKIFVTGNTIVDAVFENLKIAKAKRRDTLTTSKEYILVTLHRQENVDYPQRLQDILNALQDTAEVLKKDIVFPIHPRTKNNIEKFGITMPSNIRVVEPIGFLDFLKLQFDASLIMTDSGGVQEESCILQIPCVTIRTTTERPETVDVGANKLAGIDKISIVESAKKMILVPRTWENPFGDGRASHRILDILKNNLLVF